MAHIIADRVLETTTTTGTGPFTVGGALTGFRAFSAVMAVGDTCTYSAVGVDGSGIPTGEWETGISTYSSSNTLTRTTVTASSNAGSAVNFSAGTKRVALSDNAVTTVAPAIRATSQAVGSGTSTSVTLPTGSAAGDDCYIFVTSGYQSSAPSGWGIVDNLTGTSQNATIYHKTLVAGDISAGSVAIGFSNSFRHSIVAVTITGAAGGAYWSDIRDYASTAIGVIQNKLWRSPKMPANSLMLVALAVRGVVTIACTEGTSLQATSNTDGSLTVFSITSPNRAGQAHTPNISGAGSQTCAFIRLIVAPAPFSDAL